MLTGTTPIYAYKLSIFNSLTGNCRCKILLTLDLAADYRKQMAYGMESSGVGGVRAASFNTHVHFRFGRSRLFLEEEALNIVPSFILRHWNKLNSVLGRVSVVPGWIFGL
jgi:hypothetical protein